MIKRPTALMNIADNAKSSVESFVNNVRTFSSDTGNKLVESYKNLKDISSLGNIIISDNELEAYYNDATDENSLEEKIRLVREHLKKYPVFINISTEPVLSIENSEGEITSTVSKKAVKKIHYGNIYNFFLDNLDKDIIVFSNKPDERAYSLQSYFIIPSLDYTDPNKNFLSLYDAESAYISKISGISNIYNKSFNSSSFKNIYYKMVESIKDSNVLFSNNRTNSAVTFLFLDSTKTGIFHDYRDELITISLNSSYNALNQAAFDREFDQFLTSVVLNMEKKYVDYIKNLRQAVDNSYSNLGSAISDYNAFINENVANGVITAGSDIWNAMTSFNIADLGNSFGDLGKTLGGTFVTYFDNIKISNEKLKQDINTLQKSIGKLDYNHLDENDLCIYKTYTEYLEKVGNSDFEINTPHDMFVAEFVEILFKFFTSYSNVYVAEYQTSQACRLSRYVRSRTFDNLYNYYTKVGSVYDKVENPTLLEYNKGYYLAGKDPDSEARDDFYYLASEYSYNLSYYTLEHPDPTHGDEYSSATTYYEKKDNGLKYTKVNESTVTESNYTNYYIPKRTVNQIAIDDFTDYYYESVTDYGNGIANVYLYDKNPGISGRQLKYIAIRRKLRSFFNDLYEFHDVYRRIYLAFEADTSNKFKVNSLMPVFS